MHIYYSLWHSSSVSDTAARIITANGDVQVGKTNTQFSPHMFTMQYTGKHAGAKLICCIVNIDP
jgi:hypothetical protein